MVTRYHWEYKSLYLIANSSMKSSAGRPSGKVLHYAEFQCAPKQGNECWPIGINWPDTHVRKYKHDRVLTNYRTWEPAREYMNMIGATIVPTHDPLKADHEKIMARSTINSTYSSATETKQPSGT